jgi:hypothetical protein
VAINVGHTTLSVPTAPPETAALVSEFGVMTKTMGVTKRKAINMLARRYGLAPNDLYARLETAKKSGE